MSEKKLSEKNKKNLLENGDRLLAGGFYDIADRKYDSVLKADKHCLHAQLGRAFCLLDKGNKNIQLEEYEKALPLMQAAVNVDFQGERDLHRFRLAQCLAALGRGREAAQVLNEAVYGLVFMKYPDKVSPYAAGMVFHKAGDFGRALQCFERSIAETPDCFHSLYYAGACELALRQNREAIPFLRKALRFWQPNSDGLLVEEIGAKLKQAGECSDNFIVCMSDIVKGIPQEKVLERAAAARNIAKVLDDWGIRDKALVFSGLSLKDNPRDILAVYNMARCLKIQGCFEDITDLFAEHPFYRDEVRPGTAVFVHKIAELLFEIKEYGAALDYFESLAETFPHNESYLFGIGMCYQKMNMPDVALDQFEKIILNRKEIVSDKRKSVSDIALSAQILVAEDFERASSMLENLTQHFNAQTKVQDKYKVYHDLARCLVSQGNIEEAAIAIGRIPPEERENIHPSKNIRLALAYDAAGHSELAERFAILACRRVSELEIPLRVKGEKVDESQIKQHDTNVRNIRKVYSKLVAKRHGWVEPQF